MIWLSSIFVQETRVLKFSQNSQNAIHLQFYQQFTYHWPFFFHYKGTFEEILNLSIVSDPQNQFLLRTCLYYRRYSDIWRHDNPVNAIKNPHGVIPLSIRKPLLKGLTPMPTIAPWTCSTVPSYTDIIVKIYTLQIHWSC